MENENQTVTIGKVVSIDYVLKDAAGNQVEATGEDKPFFYLHGARNIVKGLEDALEGKAPGDTLEVTVPPEKGYGTKRASKTVRLLRSNFPAEAKVEKGARFVLQGPEGPLPVWVTKVMGREVHVTPQHPLTGQTLHYSVTVREVRDATDEERQHGHAHGPGAHEHDEHDEHE